MNNHSLIIVAIIVLLAGAGYMYWDKTHLKDTEPQKHQHLEQKLNSKPSIEAPAVPPDFPLPNPSPLNKIDPKPASYPEALALSKKNGKKMVLYFGATWCGPCKEMSPIFATQQVENALKDFVFYKMDVDNTRVVANKYKVGPIPHYCVADSEENVLKQGTGRKSANEFINWLKL